jgi:hypothetical protein
VLLAHGGWALVDPRPIQAANPTTFLLPAPDELATVQQGHTIRALFEIAELADHSIDGQSPWNTDGTPNLVVLAERMWLWVQAVEQGADGPVFCRRTPEPARGEPQPPRARRHDSGAVLVGDRNRRRAIRGHGR